MTAERKDLSQSAAPGGAHDPLGGVFERRFTAGDLATRDVLSDLIDALAQAGVNAEDLATVELILAEALNNVTEHAYANGPGPVELSVRRFQKELACQIVDRGRPMPTGAAPNPPLPEIGSFANLPEGGFGWHIIRCLTSELNYRRVGTRNMLSMLVPLKGKR